MPLRKSKRCIMFCGIFFFFFLVFPRKKFSYYFKQKLYGIANGFSFITRVHDFIMTSPEFISAELQTKTCALILIDDSTRETIAAHKITISLLIGHLFHRGAKIMYKNEEIKGKKRRRFCFGGKNNFFFFSLLSWLFLCHNRCD